LLRVQASARIRERAVGRRAVSSRRSRPEASHVAAICYRVRGREIEFLLVQSRAGRWTFPKGRVENDPSRAAAAAREAVEEAGAYGLVDMDPFARYVHAKNPEWHDAPDEHLVDAHLCEVMDTVSPEEAFRNPTWFSPGRTKMRLCDKRSAAYGQELASIVDDAVEHIARRRPRPRQRRPR
jgi:8-oxo-dGTP pyrophosphatase MutT (NUDIX family)